jgi:IS605 OrfB family transposase
MIYARGDRTKSGNPNLRVIKTPCGYELRVTVGHRDFRQFPLFVPKKFRAELDDLLASGTAYNVRLRRKDKEKCRVVIDYEFDPPPVIATRRNGVIGVDINPFRIALCFVASDGNRVWSRTLANTRMFYGSTNKTNYEVALLVKEIVSLAWKRGCAVAAEDLKFKPKFVKGWRKFNRMKSRFVWRTFLTLLERKCKENGIEFCKVNSAFTSVQGRLKYSGMFNIPVHEAAAYVIGRRALGFGETLSVYQWPHGEARRVVLRTMQEEGCDFSRHYHSWSLWRRLRDILVLTERSLSLRNPGELRGSGENCGESPQRESSSITGRRAW